MFEDRRVHRRYLASMQAILGRRAHLPAAREFRNEPRSVRVNGHTIACEGIVLAAQPAHGPRAGQRNALQSSSFIFNTSADAKRAWCLCVVLGPRIPTTICVSARWDFDLIFGGEDRKAARPTYQCLLRGLERLKMVQIDTHRWSGRSSNAGWASLYRDRLCLRPPDFPP